MPQPHLSLELRSSATAFTSRFDCASAAPEPTLLLDALLVVSRTVDVEPIEFEKKSKKNSRMVAEQLVAERA